MDVIKYILIAMLFAVAAPIGVAGAASSGQQLNVSFKVTSAGLSVSGNNASVVSITEVNVSSIPAAPQGLTNFFAFSNKVSVPNIEGIGVTAQLCQGGNADPLVPFVLVNNNWQPINPYRSNVTACIVKFTVPVDAVVSIMYVPIAHQPAAQVPPLQPSAQKATGYSIFGFIIIGVAGLIGGFYMLLIWGKSKDRRNMHV